MAARLNKRHQEFVKDKIQASQLINRLQNHALGQLELTSTQIDSAKFLLNKIISNAPQEIDSTIRGDKENPLVHEIRRIIVDAE